MNLGILDTNAEVVFFPVRHHSPACARLVRELALKIRPATILIEGPSDFNPYLNELNLPHLLPIAIYSYVELPDGKRKGAYYPFCEYSPEWQALKIASEIGAVTEFIDLPWADLAVYKTSSHRYADGELRYSNYISQLCQKFGVEDFDALWDTLFEIDDDLDLAEYFKRAHSYCFQIRTLDKACHSETHLREAFMVNRIQLALKEKRGKILVVTGGYHSYALYTQINNIVFTEYSLEDLSQENIVSIESGIALTPYSYSRLDSLTGYESGMPSPGFYDYIWQEQEKNVYQKILATTINELRERKQTVSTADVIAVEVMAEALATLRSHKRVWRKDLIDAIIGSLVKDEFEYATIHPFLEALYDIFRGSKRGFLAAGTTLPPLVKNLQKILKEHNLEATAKKRIIDLDLYSKLDLTRSRILHKLRILNIQGYKLVESINWALREDLSKVWEKWEIEWSPDFDSSCIESAIYGITLAEAAVAKIKEREAAIEKDTEVAALLLLDACLIGLDDLTSSFYNRLIEIVNKDGNFFSVTAALEHLLYLFRYDQILGTKEEQDIGKLLAEVFSRSIWLLELLGNPQGTDKKLLYSLQILLQTFEFCDSTLKLGRENFLETIGRISLDKNQSPLMHGAMMAILWKLGETHLDQLVIDIRYCASPSHLGDFLTGLFSLARELAQRHTEIVLSIDSLLMAYDDQTFLEALPALRLAFSFFTPREKHYLAKTLLKALGIEDITPLPKLEIDTELAATVLAFEDKLFKTIDCYGLRGSQK